MPSIPVFPDNVNEIYIKLANDLKSLLNQSNPFLNKSLTKAELTAFAGRIFDVYKQIQALIDQNFDDTRTGEFLIREASDYGITLIEATGSSGTISAVGTLGTNIPDETEFSINGLVYKTDGDVAISTKIIAVTGTYVADVVTLDFASDHNLGTGQDIVLSGFANPLLNTTHTVTVIDANTVEIIVDSLGSGSDSGTATFDNAVLNVVSDGTGLDYNRNQGEVLDIGTAIAGITSQAVVTANGIIGGTDEETEEELRARLQQRKKNPASFFNEAQVEAIFRTFAIVDRVFIQPITPSIGEATIYFVKDNNEIPSAGEVEDVKDLFEPYLPINCDYTVIHVLAPIPLPVAFIFSSIDPDTPTMRQAIEDNLEAFFEDRTNVEENISEDVYRGVIINTVDPDSLQRLNSFTLISPSGNIIAASGELPVLDSVTF